ncbi:MAG: hypothetical protein ACKPKO_26155, partial [Candidatus Fonsibacter sp.]
ALKKINDKYSYDDISFPVSYEDISKFEEMNEVCIFVYEIDEDKIIKSKEGNTDYLLKDLVYLLRVEDGDKAHYIYIKNVAHFFNLSEHCIEGNHRYCPICSKQISLKEYD